MPVIFFVDPTIATDEETRRIVHELTLSYTFYPVAAPKQTEDRPRPQARTTADEDLNKRRCA